MTKRSRTPRLLAAAIAFALVGAACGGDDGDSTAAPEPTAVDTTAAAPTETTAAETTESTEAMAGDGPTGPACAAVPADGEGSFAGMTDDTAATAASNNPVLSTLVTAVSEAGLVDTLNSDGPFTIFAPTNDAFAAIPEADLAAVLADQDLLTSILTYHVVAGESLGSADLIERGTVTTVNGAELAIAAGDDGSVMVGGQASVGCADVMTANATVHIIDAVLMP
jgi:transforming growth factor-beta-induced protein